jgi:hypothetical protein
MAVERAIQYRRLTQQPHQNSLPQIFPNQKIHSQHPQVHPRSNLQPIPSTTVTPTNHFCIQKRNKCPHWRGAMWGPIIRTLPPSPLLNNQGEIEQVKRGGKRCDPKLAQQICSLIGLDMESAGDNIKMEGECLLLLFYRIGHTHYLPIPKPQTSTLKINYSGNPLFIKQKRRFK